MRRPIAVFTATRAEYGLLRRVILGLQDRGERPVSVLASGAHLSQQHGNTIRELERDGVPIVTRVDIGLEGGDSPLFTCQVMGRALCKIGEALATMRPTLLVLLGDRYETFCAAAAAQIMGIPVAHIHGGETTEGAVDEAFRHSITKMSHLHFSSCEVYRKRVMQLGESPETVWNVGSLGVENVRLLPLPDEKTIRSYLQMEDGMPYIVSTLHPETLTPDSGEGQCRALLAAFVALPQHVVVFTGANADPGGNDINRMLQQAAGINPARFRFHMSLGVVNYLAAVKFAACVVGNSSSGVIEVPSLGVPVVDIGDRQKGRVRSGSVIHSEPAAKSIAQALLDAVSPERRKMVEVAMNPYDKPGTARAIIDIVTHHSDGLSMKKRFFDVAYSL